MPSLMPQSQCGLSLEVDLFGYLIDLCAAGDDSSPSKRRLDDLRQVLKLCFFVALSRWASCRPIMHHHTQPNRLHGCFVDIAVHVECLDFGGTRCGTYARPKTRIRHNKQARTTRIEHVLVFSRSAGAHDAGPMELFVQEPTACQQESAPSHNETKIKHSNKRPQTRAPA